MKLYTWQRDCLRAWEKSRRRGIVHVVTGAGKTILALAAMDRFLSDHPDGRVKIVVPTIPLARQWQTALFHHASQPGMRPGFFGGGIRDDADRPVMIYIVNSARQALPLHVRRDFALGRHVLLICDECHHYGSPQNRHIFDFAQPSPASAERYAALGLSATPFTTPGGDVLTRALGPEIFRYDADCAASDGIVSSFFVCEVAVSFLPGERDAYQQLSYEMMLLGKKLLRLCPSLQNLSSGDYIKAISRLAKEADMDPSHPAAAFLLTSWRRKEISILAEARLLCGISLIEQLPLKSRILIFCERIEQAEKMAQLVRRRFGSVCGLYHSKMSMEARERNMADFREGRCRILVSCRCLDEGIDVPEASVGIALSGASVSRQRIQRLGRVIRRSEGKAAAALYYLYVQESAEDACYLPGLPEGRCVPMRYRSLERSFENELYLYAASEILGKAEERGLGRKQIKELRRCLDEGAALTDYLLPQKAQRAALESARSVHERNYWLAMMRMGQEFSRT